MSSIVVTLEVLLDKQAPVLKNNIVEMGTSKYILKMHVLKPIAPSQTARSWLSDVVSLPTYLDVFPNDIALSALQVIHHHVRSNYNVSNTNALVLLVVDNVPEGSVIVSFLEKHSKEPCWEDKIDDNCPWFHKVSSFDDDEKEEKRTYLAVFPSVEVAVNLLDENQEEKNEDGTYKKVKIIPWDCFGLAHESIKEIPIEIQLPWGTSPAEQE